MTTDDITGRLGCYSIHEDPTLLDEAADLIVDLLERLAAAEAACEAFHRYALGADEYDADAWVALDAWAVARRSQP